MSLKNSDAKTKDIKYYVRPYIILWRILTLVNYDLALFFLYVYTIYRYKIQVHL